MLNLTKKFPLIFSNKTCCACGKINALEMYDKFGNVVDPDIKPVAYIRCKFCHATYGQNWVIDENNNLYAEAVNPSLKEEVISKFGLVIDSVKENLFNLLH